MGNWSRILRDGGVALLLLLGGGISTSLLGAAPSGAIATSATGAAAAGGGVAHSGGTAMSPASVVQDAHSADGSSAVTSYTVGLTGVGTGANHSLLLFSSNASSSGGVASVTDNAGTHYTWRRVLNTHFATPGNGSPPTMDIWIGTGGSGGSVTVTVHYGAPSLIGGALFELNAAATPVRRVLLSTPIGDTAAVSTPVTTTANQLVMAFLGTSGFGQHKTGPTSWTNYAYPQIDTGEAGAVAYRPGDGSSLSASWNGSTGSTWIAASLTIAGPTTPAPPRAVTYTLRSGFPTSSIKVPTCALTTTDVGDAVVVLVNSQGTTIQKNPVISDTNHRVTWTPTPISIQRSNPGDPSSSWMFLGVVTSVGTTTATVTWSTTPGTLQSIAGYEFSSSLGTAGTWATVNAGAERRGTGQVLSTDGLVTYPPLWSGPSAGVYIGYTGLQTTPSITTTTTGFHYYTYSVHGTSGFISCYDATLSANTMYAPTVHQPQSTGGVVDANAAIIYAYTYTPIATTPFSTTPGSTTLSQTGYDLVGSDGGVFVLNPTGHTGGFYGSLPGMHVVPNRPVVGMVPTVADNGYFLVGADGGVYAFGAAPFLGSLPGLKVTPNAPIVGIVAANADKGYFLVGRDGGVYAFGTVPFLGSLPGDHITVDNIIGIAAIPNGHGYWVVSATGTVYGFGSAAKLGTATGTTSPVSAIAGTPTGGGYWITTQNGTVYDYGKAVPHGTLPGINITPNLPIIGIVRVAGTVGYWLIGADGGIFAFGTAPFVGSLPGLTPPVHVTNIVGAVPN